MSKTVLITGASSGIGKATALYFLENGWNVAATMRSVQNAADMAKLERVLCTRLDVTEPHTIDKAINETIDKFGGLDVVVNNAGYALRGVFESTSAIQIEKQFKTNLFGLFDVVKGILPHFRKKKQGMIINVASVGGRVGFPLYALYNASKWGIEGFSESLRYELSPFNIQVKVIEPGVIRTDFYSRSMVERSDEEQHSEYGDYVARVMEKTDKSTGGFTSTPDKVARVIYLAATDQSEKFRYPAKGGAKLLLFARKFLPDALFLRMMKKMFG
ncbi:MAG: SDR family oxidoreductase [Spirochaetales bacterium]|nr:SDR family oxidoreductase [Spirochaetales bacterium]